MLADRVAEHLDHQVGEAVDDLRLIAEALGGVHHAEHFHDALDLVEAAEMMARGCEQVQSDLACRLVALLHGEIFSELAFGGALALPAYGPVTGEKEQV